MKVKKHEKYFKSQLIEICEVWDAHTTIEKVKWFLSIESESMASVCPFNIFFYEIKIFVIDEIQFLPFSSRPREWEERSLIMTCVIK